jgi:hypothetical protein
MRHKLLIVIAALAVAPLGRADRLAAAEQSPPPADQSAAGEKQQVTITGQHELERRINSFVLHLTDFGDLTTGMARWREPICPLVSGISAEQGNFVLGRISEIAQAAGAPLAGKNCRPNMVIMVSAKPLPLLQDLVKRHRTALFGDAAQSLIDAWVARSRPVRTWYDTVEKTPDGLPMLHTAIPADGGGTVDKNGNPVAVAPSDDAAKSFETNEWSQASHLTLNGIWTIYRVVEVVDATQLNGASLGQIADYVALSGLAQLRQDAQLGDDPTILGLFDKDPRTASPGLTDWDRAFLKSLYFTEQQTVIQRREIAQDMVRAVSAP